MNQRTPVPQTFVQQDILFQQLSELIREMERLFKRVEEEVNRVTHTNEPNEALLARECALFTRDFQRFAQVIIMLRDSIEKRLMDLQAKSSCKFKEPVLASRFQTIMVLHMVGELGMNKRLEELRSIESRTKETRVQYEQQWTAIKERFEETAHRLNLLLYMRDCLAREGVLPANIMYSPTFPQVLQSPFGMRDMTTKVKEAAILKPAVERHEITKQTDQEKFLEEMAKKRELLLQLRAAAREEAKNEVKNKK